MSGFSDWDCHREVREAECGSIKIIEIVPPRAALETCAEMNVSAVKHLEITLSFSLNVWK